MNKVDIFLTKLKLKITFLWLVRLLLSKSASWNALSHISRHACNLALRNLNKWLNLKKHTWIYLKILKQKMFSESLSRLELVGFIWRKLYEVFLPVFCFGNYCLKLKCFTKLESHCFLRWKVKFLTKWEYSNCCICIIGENPAQFFKISGRSCNQCAVELALYKVLCWNSFSLF